MHFNQLGSSSIPEPPLSGGTWATSARKSSHMSQDQNVVFKRPMFAFENLTPLPNGILRNPGLSAGEKGMLAYLLSHKAGYSLTMAQIIAENKGGKDAINKLVAGLEKAGFLTRNRLRDSQGRLGRYSWELTMDEVGNPTRAGFTSAENPTVDVTCENVVKPQVGTSAGFTTVVKPAPYKTTNLNNTKEKEELLPPTSVVVGALDSDDLPLFNVQGEKPKTQRQKPRTRISEDFTVSSDMLAWAKEKTKDVDVAFATAEFVQYWLGCGKPMADWVATWRGAMIRAQKRAEERKSRTSSYVRSSYRPFQNPVDASAYEGAI